MDWFSYLSHFAWGLKKFVLKEKEDPPSHYEMKKGAGTHFYFSDIQWTFNHGKRIRSIYRNQLKKRILESKSVSALLTSN